MGQGTSEVMDERDADRAPNEPEVERLVEDIEETRDQMTDTVEEIGDRLDPRHIVADAKETIREATVGKVETMATTASEMATEATESVRDAGAGLLDTITRNPLPAAMVGVGLGWLAMSGRSRQNGDRVQVNARRTDPMRQARVRADEMATEVGDAMDRAAVRAGELVDEVPERVRTTAGRIGETASDVFRGSPLAVGAIAVAVGAAVGLALPATPVERRTLGQPARQAIRKVEEVATEALGQVEDQARDAEQQARQEDRQARPH